MPRFENLRKTADRVEKGTLKPTPHPEVEERQSTAKTSSLKDKLGAKKPSSATVRMSVEVSQEMHDQITTIATRAGIAKVEVIREILKDTLPELL